jgi:uncharacterized protein YjbI with pentapeptide repeats
MPFFPEQPDKSSSNLENNASFRGSASARPQPRRALSSAAKAQILAIDCDLAARRHFGALPDDSLSRMIAAFRQALSENPRDLNVAFARARAVRHRRGAPPGNENRKVNGRRGRHIRYLNALAREHIAEANALIAQGRAVMARIREARRQSVEHCDNSGLTTFLSASLRPLRHAASGCSRARIAPGSSGSGRLMLKSLYHEPRRALAQAELNAILLAHERLLSYQRGAAKAELSRTRLDGLNLANRNLAEADFAFASLVGAVAFGTNFDRANLHCSDLRDSDFASARLTKADLRGASICGARLAFAKLDGADLRAATVAYKGPDAAKANANVRVDFSNASLKGASFGHARLDGVSFEGAILEGANFKNAQLANVSFKGAVLTGVNVDDIDLPDEAFEGCVFGVTQDAVDKAQMIAAALDAHKLCVTSGASRGAPAVLNGEDLRPIRDRFAGMPLSGLSARNVLAIGTDFSGCQLQGARFDGADLRECEFGDADLRGASFRGARLAHAKFEKANLGSLRLPGGQILAPDFTGAEAVKAQFFHAILDKEIGSLGLKAAA